MLHEPRIDETTAEAWVRRGGIAAAAYSGLCAVGGLTLVAVKVVAGAYAEAIITLIVTAATCGIGLMAIGAMRLGRIVISNAEALAALRYRIDALEAAFEAQGIDLELDPSADDPAELVGAVLPRDRYPRLAGEKESQVEATHEGDVATEAGEPKQPAQRELGTMSDLAQARELREEFAAQVRAGRYERALALGDEIAAVAPASRMAADYDGIRERLAQLAERQARSRRAL